MLTNEARGAVVGYLSLESKQVHSYFKSGYQ
jgi:hypothetical protein